jgi:Fic family protein
MLNYMSELKQSDRKKYSFFETKYLRCRKIEELLKQKKMRRIDIAREFGVHKSTAGRYINDLSLVVRLVEDDNGYLYVDKM